MATKKESDKTKILQQRIAEDKARASEAKKAWEEANPDKLRQQNEAKALKRKNEAKQFAELMMRPRKIRDAKADDKLKQREESEAIKLKWQQSNAKMLNQQKEAEAHLGKSESISVDQLRANLKGFAREKGLRLGINRRANYVYMGSGDLYYKSSDISQITNSSSQELLSELNQKQNKMRLWPVFATTSIFTFFTGLSYAWPDWQLFVTLIAGFVLTYMVFGHDMSAKTVLLFYDFDPEMEKIYTQFHSATEKMVDCSAAWHIEDRSKVDNRKYHAGASSLVNRKTTFIRKSEPPHVKSNIETIAIGVGRKTLYFFPDRILIYNSNGVEAIGYQELRINVQTSRFIEEGVLPKDANVVDRTWKFVNKSGGPDRRFKGNREIPICLYDEISLSSQTGLNEVLQISQSNIAGAFAVAILALTRKIPKEK